jgi:ectoine hydroxylase-related dioxygenase (phytanoyl-CoA dioxygenase family)
VFERLDFDRFHRDDVPALLARGNGKLGAPAAERLGAIAFVLPDGRAWTYEVVDGDIAVRPGSDGARTVIRLDEPAWSDFATEAHTTPGLLYAGLVTFDGDGGYDALDRWEAALRALFTGRPIYDASTVTDLDLNQSFSLGDPELAGYLQRAGFAVLRGVFSADEVAAVSNEVEHLRTKATVGDRRSWWAKNASGDDVLCRLIYSSLASDTIAEFAMDERFDQIMALAGTPLVRALDRLDGVSVVIKNSAVVEGLSDLPWHRDCGLGGHPVLCPGFNIGVQLDHANADNGQLHFLAGSHNSSGAAPSPKDTDLPTVAVDPEPGDVTVHFGHVFHAAPPPLSPTAGRRAMYVTCVEPKLFDVIGHQQGYNDILFEATADGHIASVDERLANAQS